MKWSFSIGRIGGTDVKIHVTFVVLVAWLALDAYTRGGSSAAAEVTVALVALFSCVLLHEFGHILMARRFGVRTPDVILLPIGGLARLERMPEEPREELLIAAAGPAVTLAIILVLYGVVLAAGVHPGFGELLAMSGGILTWILSLNIYLLLFNLLPIFPMDGGRMVRALLAMRVGLPRATRIAAQVGQVGAVLMGIAGLGLFARWGVPGNWVLVLIAVFVYFAAGAEAASVETRTAGRGLTVRELMITQFVALPVYATLQQAADALLAGEQREFPVVDNWGKVEGLLTREALIRGLSQLGGAASVERAMVPAVEPLPLALPFEEALERLGRTGLPALPVVDERGALVGLLTRDNVSDVLLVRRAGVRPPPAGR